MKKITIALLTVATVFLSTAVSAAPVHAATTTHQEPADGWIMVVYFDHYPPSTYSNDSGYFGTLFAVRQLSNGMWEGKYLGYY